jgi:hypothetical protein
VITCGRNCWTMIQRSAGKEIQEALNGRIRKGASDSEAKFMNCPDQYSYLLKLNWVKPFIKIFLSVVNLLVPLDDYRCKKRA